MGQSGEWGEGSGEDNILYIIITLTGNEVLGFSSNSNSSISLLLRQSNTSQHCGTPSINLRQSVFSELFFIQLTTHASNSTQSASTKSYKIYYVQSHTTRLSELDLILTS